MELKVSVTVTQVGEDGSERRVDGELAAALAGPAGQFGKMVTRRRGTPAPRITGTGRR